MRGRTQFLDVITGASVRHPKGTTLIEALVLLFLFTVVSLSFYQTWTVGTQMIIESKNRLGAVALANARMEIVHNLDYDAIGTQGGIPAGDILQDETVTANTREYQVNTLIKYVDDPFDGTSTGSPADVVPNDYKRVRITVKWGSGGPQQSVILTSSFVPKGVEQSAGGGILSINVMDGSGNGIGQATVHLTNSTTTPAVDITTPADSTGNVTFVAAPEASQSYRVEVSKPGYYSVHTYQPTASPVFNPLEADMSVVAGALNQLSIVTDQAQNITIRTKDALGADLPDVAFKITGGKQIGTDKDNAKVYDFSDVAADSGSGASVGWMGRSAGAYALSEYAKTGYTFLWLSTQESPRDQFTVSPGTDEDVTMTFADQNIGSALVAVTNQSTGVAVAGAQVHVTDTTLGYDATATTNAYGEAYFPTAAPALATGTYDISVTASGFADASGTVSVDGALETVPIAMQPN